jgi:phosphate/sulfate permease
MIVIMSLVIFIISAFAASGMVFKFIRKVLDNRKKKKSFKLLKASVREELEGFVYTEILIEGIASVLDSWGMRIENATKVALIFLDTVEKGKISYEQYGRALSEVALIAVQAGISFKDISEAVIELTNMGIPISHAITQIKESIESSDFTFNIHFSTKQI